MKSLVFVALFSPVALFAQLGNEFPYMEAETLTNEFLNLPEDTKGKHTVIGLAYSKKSEKDLRSWFQPAYQQFIYKPETPSLFAGNYDVNCYFIPMFTGAKRVAYKKSMDKVKEDIDRRLLPHVLFYQGSLRDYKDQLNFDGKDVPYFFILDPEGKIVHATSGAYTDRKMQEILTALDDAWGN
jgi:hypothetical protein